MIKENRQDKNKEKHQNDTWNQDIAHNVVLTVMGYRIHFSGILLFAEIALGC